MILRVRVGGGGISVGGICAVVRRLFRGEGEGGEGGRAGGGSLKVSSWAVKGVARCADMVVDWGVGGRAGEEGLSGCSWRLGGMVLVWCSKVV